MSDYIWETFDSLFRTAHAQGKRVEALEARIADLESKLAAQTVQPTKEKEVERTTEDREPATVGR